MNLQHLTARAVRKALTVSALLVTGAAAYAAPQVVSLTAGPAVATLPDGNAVPMWGYSCGAAVSGSSATCQALNPTVQAANVAAIAAGKALPGQWSPVIITIPVGQDLQVNLSNQLSFATTGTPNGIPTSLTIVGQIGGGLGTNPAYVDSPVHPSIGQTWSTANAGGTSFVAPPQPQRVQSFATEVAAGQTTSLCWGACGAGFPALKPGTYLIESGTHPSIQGPMGLYGVLVVTNAPTASAGTETGAGTAYPASALQGTTKTFYPNGVTYDAEVALLLSEIDPVQNNAVQTAVNTAGFAETASQVLGNSITNVTVTSGGAGYTVAGPNNTTLTSGTLPITFSPQSACKLLPSGTATITNGQVTALNVTPIVSNTSTTAYGTGCVETVSASVAGGSTPAVITLTTSSTATGIQCGIPAGGTSPALACYPPAVNYTPTYFLVNGGAFDRTHAANALYATSPATLTGNNVLVRVVNAGLRMHVPSIVGATTTTSFSPNGSIAPTSVPGMTLVAEDGNPIPGVPRIMNDVMTVAGKTYDLLVNAVPACTPAAPGGSCTANALPIFDRALGLSGGTIDRDAGMLAYIGTNGSTVPQASNLKAAVANADTYNALAVISGQTRSFSISDASKGVIANDVNVYGVTLLTQASNGVVSLNRNGTFTYTAKTGSTATTDSFSYCANGTVSAGVCSSGITATVSLGAANIADAGLSCTAISFTASTNVSHIVSPPGVLGACTDAANLTMTVQGATATVPATVTMAGPGTGTAYVDANGGFRASVSAAGTYTFNVTPVSSLGLAASSPVTVTVVFPSIAAGSGLNVSVLDGSDKKTLITDYRWVIEEDRTFYVDPGCTTNPLPAGCPTVNTNTGGSSSQFNYGTSFHTSSMPVVASGCTGPLSCEAGQSLLGVPAVCDVGNGVCRTSGTQFTSLLPSNVVLDPTKRYYISILPGDAANPFIAGYLGASNCTASGGTSVSTTTCGHGMGGSNINKGQTNVIVLTQPSPYPAAHVTAFVYEDDYPLNGEHDAGGGVDVLAAQEPGLGGFQIMLQDVAGATGAMTGTPTYDMFNEPLSNSMAGTIDPVTLLDACPISQVVTNNVVPVPPFTANVTAKSKTFTVAATSAVGLSVGMSVADTAGAFPAGTTITGISGTATYIVTLSNAAAVTSAGDSIVATTATSGSQAGITGMIVTCPKYEADGKTLSPLSGMAMVNNLYPGRYSIQAIPGADRVARGEEWLQTNTLDGQKSHDAFLRIGEPAYFQEYGPSGFHVNIGFANPKIINERRHNAGNSGWCDSGALNSLTNGNGAVVGKLDCSNTVDGYDYLARMSRTPDERLYSSGSRTALAFTQCYAALSDPDGATFYFTKCDPVTGYFYFGPSSTGANDGVPAGNWMLTIFDQWNDQIIDGISTPVGVACLPTAGGGLCSSTNAATGAAVNNATGTGQVIHLGEVATHQWQSNIYTKIFLDTTGTGLWKDSATAPAKPGLALVTSNVRFRDGSISNFNVTDLTGTANLNEVFPLFNWYVMEADDTRFKNTGVHVVYDAGGPVDNSTPGGQPCAYNASGVSGGVDPCGTSVIGTGLANTYEKVPLPTDLRIPGAVYCGNGTTADCYGKSIASGSAGSDPVNCSDDKVNGGVTCTGGLSTGRIDPPLWFGTYGWQGYSGQANFLEFGKKPYVPGETGGIRGHVVYASTRPYDNPTLLLQNLWEPLVPHVTINLYKQTLASDGVTQQLTLIDTTTTTSWDDWAQGYRTNAAGALVMSSDTEGGAIPNMSCPGQSTADLFFYGIKNQPQWIDFYNNQLHGTAGSSQQMAYNAQFKCYDGMHTWNQLQPAPYDGMYTFPSVNGFDPTTGRPTSTNCSACVTNVDSTDPYRYGGSTTAQPWVNGTSTGTPVLPAGNYVVEVVVPPGYALVKEEDKNILIGDNFVAPATMEIPGLNTNIFILPDQAAIGSTMNVNNAQNPTTALGRNVLPNSEADTGMQEQYWPCVGALRQVPDYISLFPQSQQVSPFAGAMRNLCDRKLVTLSDQTSAQAKFYIFTPTHIAGHFTGIILDDFTSEFDPYSPQFGEKFAPAYLPVSVKDWAGNEVNRVYSDQFGLYNGLSYSTWEVNPPNPTGYAPTMMVMCMNDSGYGTQSPWWDPAAAGTVSPKRDPFFQTGYSQFCYELPFMPGRTGYFDTPVTPDAAFTDGYNHPDCAYPNLTPAISSVAGDVAGPWVKAAGSTLTINAQGDAQVDNYGYSGPAISKAPYSNQEIVRHYGFGGKSGTVTIGGVKATVTSWSDQQIMVTVPTGVPNCAVQQQAQYQVGATVYGSSAQCGQLQITTAPDASGHTQQSVDTVTVTIGGKAPTILTAGSTIQSAIDAASPGDLIIVPAGVYNEMVVMWKPVRLQGVGAVSTVIDSNAQPAGKLLDPWRQRIDCLFGLTPQGRPRANGDMSCATGWKFATGYQSSANDRTNDVAFPVMMVDRLPFEAVLGWDATLNGNLAEQSIEPSLMGAEEGAAITVLAKGVRFIDGPHNPTTVFDAFGSANGAIFPNNTVLLTAADCQVKTTLPATIANGASAPTFGRNAIGGSDTTNRYPGNFQCNPSSIDGLSLRDASQGGGGIYVHAYAHNLQIANNRVYNNLGTLSGGITIGQGEHPDANLTGANAVITLPNSCEAQTSLYANTTNVAMPFCFDLNVNVHNNAVYSNVSLGDELFSSTPAGAGGISVNTGADYYQVSNNWICGNLSSGDGGGLSHIGFIKNGEITNNTILFNKSANPSISTNGAGLLVMGAPDVDPTCGANNDQDCVPLPSTVTPSDGSGPGTVINANLILGNSADAGSGGGVRLQNINGNDIVNFPNPTVAKANGVASYTQFWNHISLTNNIIVNNVAGWDGGGVSLQDALYIDIVNNTIAHNDATATAGPLFGSLFAPMASAPTTQVGCYATASGVSGANGSTVVGVASCPQVAGLVSVPNSAVLQANTVAANGTNVATALTCPAAYGGVNCWTYSTPLIFNDMVWQNRSFVVTTGGLGGGALDQQQVVTLMNADPTFPPSTTASNPVSIQSQTATGMCPTAGSAYWDLGVRGDIGPKSPQAAGVQLYPYNSAIDDLTLYANTPAVKYNNVGGAAFTSGFMAAYCNGGRTPPEAGGQGWFVPPGTNETNGSTNGGTSNPNGTNPMYFSLVATATTDEGNNWINMRWGPLSLTFPGNDSATSNSTAPQYLGNYAIGNTSGAIGTGIAAVAGVAAPATDYFGNARPSSLGFDIGAVEFQPTPPQISVSTAVGNSLNVQTGQTGNVYVVTVTNSAPAHSGNLVVTPSITGSYYTVASTCPSAIAGGVPVGGSCTLTVVFAPLGNAFVASGTTVAGTLTVASNASNGAGTNAPTVALAAVAFPPLAAFGTTPNIVFPNVEIGAKATASVVLTNTGYGPWYTTAEAVTPAAVYGTTTGTGACSNNTPVAVGASCTLYLTFDSAKAVVGDVGKLTETVGAFLGNTHGGQQATTTITDGLSATAVTPSVTVSPATTYNFGNVQTGQTVSVTWTITNNSGVAISLPAGSDVIAGVTNEFTLGGTCPGNTTGGSLNAGASCTVVLSFRTASANQFNVNYYVSLVSDGVTLTNLTGTVVQTVAPSASLTGTGAFGTVKSGTKSAVHTFTYKNTGAGPVTLAAANPVTLTGTNGNQFQIATGTTCTANLQLAAGATCSVNVDFAPTSTGAKSANLNVVDANGGAGTTTIGLTGTGN